MSAREQRSEREGRRRTVPIAVGIAAVPVGLTLAGALVLSGVGDNTDPADGTNAAGEIGESVGDDSGVPDASADDDFFDTPTGASEAAEPQGDSDPQDAQVTASSNAEDSDDDGDGGRGDSDGGSGGSGGGSGDSGSGGGVGVESAGGPQAAEVVNLVNDERSSHGCGPVDVDDRLTAAAQEHSQDMDDRDYMAHDSPDGEGPGERAQRHGYNAFGAENVAKGQQSAEQVMNSWMDSPGHRDNILNCGLESIGVGEAGNAWTQKFGWE
ncbi:CAP domain-containing protein [Nocardiopsis nanhaiensis]